MFVYAPTLLMEGPVHAVVLATITAALGVWLVSVGVVGYLTRLQSAVERVLYVVAGISLVIPADAFPGALATDVGGFVLGVVLVLREFLLRRRAGAAKAAVSRSGA
jgi:TRAP-type uncharacterized transport system fused permease subunit